MMKTAARGTLMLAVLTGIVAACGKGGPSEAEFVEACKTTQATPAACACAAKEAKKQLSTKLYTLMVLDMQGKRQEVAALAEDMSFDERAKFAEQQFAILGKCMPME
jgi:hypothetical protein